jgi:hypothetical protein
MRFIMKKFVLSFIASTTMLLGVIVLTPSMASGDQIPAGWEASNMKPIGYSGLEGRGGAFKMAIRHIGDHWYLYMGHLWNRGWDIVDVTDPTNPKVAKFIPGPENTWTINLDLSGNLMVTAVGNINPGWGGDPDKPPAEEGAIFWDISDPLNPKVLSHWETGTPAGTHRNGYPGGKYAYLSAAMPGYKSNILLILDVSDPRHPKEAGRWWMPGQKIGEEPTNSNPMYYFYHGPPVIDGNIAYLGYGPGIVSLDISDIAHPKLIGQLNVSPPLGGGLPVHDVLKIPGKPLLFAHSEAIAGDNPNSQSCDEPLPLVSMIDITDPAKLRLMSMFPLPVPPKNAPYKDFCEKGGRFGPHNTNLLQHLPDVEKQADLIYLTYFNAGLRIFNIEDPRMPKEVGWFIPPTPTKRFGPIPSGILVNQTEDVLVDTRGNIYITDKQWGLWVLRYTGQGEPAPTAK